jgi:hypothetical protein
VAPEKQANVARLRDTRAMVNETHALDALEFRATALAPMEISRSRQPPRRRKPEIVNLAHAHVTQSRTDF